MALRGGRRSRPRKAESALHLPLGVDGPTPRKACHRRLALLRGVLSSTLQMAATPSPCGPRGLGGVLLLADPPRRFHLGGARPDDAGDERAERLAELRTTHPTLPVLLISGFDERETLRAHGDDPATRFLQKPFTIAALRGAVRGMLTG